MSTVDKPRALVSGFLVATDFHALAEVEVFIWLINQLPPNPRSKALL